MPDSGMATALISQLNWGWKESARFWGIPYSFYLRSLKTSLSTLTDVFLLREIFWLGESVNQPILIRAIVLIGFLFLASFAMLKKRNFDKIIYNSNLKKINFMLVYAGVLFVSYTFYMINFMYTQRYFFPISFIWMFYFSVLLVAIVEVGGGKRSKKIYAILCLFIAGCFLGKYIDFYHRAHHNKLELPFSGYYGVSMWLNENTEKEAIIGAFQSGTMSFFVERRLINLDGVVNKKAYNALLNKQLTEYLIDKKVDYVVEWPQGIENFIFDNSSNKQLAANTLKLLKNDIYFFDIYKVVRN